MADPFYATGQYDQAIAMLHKFAGVLPPWSTWLLAMSYAQTGRQKEATAAMADLSQRIPDLSFERMLSEFGAIPDQVGFAQYLDGARKAGMRDCATPEELQKYPKMTHLAVCDAKRATN
jgi:hypothetical protein